MRVSCWRGERRRSGGGKEKGGKWGGGKSRGELGEKGDRMSSGIKVEMREGAENERREKDGREEREQFLLPSPLADIPLYCERNETHGDCSSIRAQLEPYVNASSIVR